MPSPTYQTAREIVEGAEAFRRQMHEQDAQRSSGVRWAGFAEDDFRPLSVAAKEAEIRRVQAKTEAFQASPQWRFIKALLELESIGYAEEAYKARSCMNRGFTFGEPVNVREVGCAMLVLNPLAGQDARDARAALAEILLQVQPIARAA